MVCTPVGSISYPLHDEVLAKLVLYLFFPLHLWSSGPVNYLHTLTLKVDRSSNNLLFAHVYSPWKTGNFDGHMLRPYVCVNDMHNRMHAERERARPGGLSVIGWRLVANPRPPVGYHRARQTRVWNPPMEDEFNTAQTD